MCSILHSRVCRFNIKALVWRDRKCACPLLNGMKIPDVTVKTADGSPFELMSAIQKKTAELVFYRGGW